MGQNTSRTRRPRLYSDSTVPPSPAPPPPPPPSTTTTTTTTTIPSVVTDSNHNIHLLAHPQHPAEPEPTTPADSEPPPPPEQHDGPPQSLIGREREERSSSSSVRKSLLSLIKPNVRSRSRVDSAGSGIGAAAAARPHRSWRSSKRWSKAPPLDDRAAGGRDEDNDDDGVGDSDTVAASSSVVVPPATAPTTAPAAAAPTAVTATTTTTVPEENEKVEEQPVALVPPEQGLHHIQAPHSAVSFSNASPSRASHTYYSEPQIQPQSQAAPAPAIQQPPSSSLPPSSTNDSESESTTTDSVRETGDVAATSAEMVTSTASPTMSLPPPLLPTATVELPIEQQATTSFPDQPHQHGPAVQGHGQGQGYGQAQAPIINPANRQFPPPGTLVVVQGIVHTTDAPRSTLDRGGGGGATPAAAAATATPSNVPTSGNPIRARPHYSSPSDYSRNRLSALLGMSGSSRPASRTSDRVGASASASAGGGEEGVTELGPSSTSSLSSPAFGSTNSFDPGRTDVNMPVVEESLPEQQPQQQQQQQRDHEWQAPPPLPPPSEHPNSAISSNSIDVLGTLLSVAAAATAASLLTGSSEPILSSGLAPPTPNSTNSSFPSSSSASSSTSSTSSPPFPPHSPSPLFPSPSHTRPTGIGDMSPAGRAERMRQAWSTIRERLGLRANANQNLTNNNSNNGGRQRERNQAFTDTREQMLAEMARAFNIGLGLGPNGNAGVEEGGQPGHGHGQQGDEAGVGRGGMNDAEGGVEVERGQGESSRTLPPEGSFDRFLVELQADLRTALSQERQEQGQGGEHGREEGEREGGEGRAVVGSAAPGRTNVEGEGEASTASSSSTNRAPGDDNRDMPPLQYVSCSDSEDEEDESPEDDFSSATTSPLPAIAAVEQPPAQTTPNQAQAAEPQTSATDTTAAGPTSGSNSTMDASGRINWWRLYRFPPITSTRPGPIPVPTLVPSLPPNPTLLSSPVSSASTSTLNPNSTRPLSEPPQSTTGAPFRSDSANNNNNNNSNTVVPVIIVGLQSVNMPNWRPVVPMEGMEGADMFGEGQHNHHTTTTRTRDQGHQGSSPSLPPPPPDWFGEDDMEDDFGVFGNQNRAVPSDGVLGGGGRGGAAAAAAAAPGGGGSSSMRGWQSRAANALRNLRPGSSNRRSQGVEETSEMRQQEMGGLGSRTFLIYVIGGYYPPDHSIVTGGPDNLESFEALLELVELLGSIKPPTATKEDIEKSGLEVIKPWQLTQYERDGKIASNCTERCLICLDDYEEQDEVRVMGCRHAFHKGCVDKWLQTGKNNCPACRTRGVSTDGPSSSPQTVS